jgi:tetratricopeptide (TPR) repeat protein
VRGVACLFALWLFASIAIAQTGELRRADALIKEGKPKEALAFLQSIESQNSASAEYHYLVGIAAIDSGDLDLAVKSLKEALRIKPDLLQARAELGRAWLLMGDYLAAYFEFEKVKHASPPPEVVAGMTRYVDQLHDYVLAQRKRYSGSVAIGFGYDSNVNAATAASQITLPLFGGIEATLDPAGREQHDTFYALNAEIGGYYPLSGNLELIGGAAARAKINSDVKNFNYKSFDVSGGARLDLGGNRFGLIANFEEYYYDYNRARETAGLIADWRRVVHPLAELTVFVQAAELTYPQDRTRDADRYVAGVGVIPAAFGKRLLYMPPLAVAYFGEERETNPGVPHLGHEFWGARLGDVHFFSSRLQSFVGLSYEDRQYGGPDPLFLVERHDRQWDLSVGAYYRLDGSWSLLPALAYSDTKSNIEVFKYRRTAAMLSARYLF